MRSAGGNGGERSRGAARTGTAGTRVLWIVIAALLSAVVVTAGRQVLRRRSRRTLPPSAGSAPVAHHDNPAPLTASTVPDSGFGPPAEAEPNLPPPRAPDVAGPVGVEPAPDDVATPAYGLPVVVPGPLDRDATDPRIRLPPRPPAARWPATDPRLRHAAVPVGVGAGPGMPAPAPHPPHPGPMPFHPAPVAVAQAPGHRWGLGAYLLAQAVFLIVSVLLGFVLFEDGSLSAGGLALAIAVPGLVTAGVAVVITLVRGNGPLVDFGLRWSWRELGIGLAFGFGGLFVSLPASAVYVGVVGEDASSAVGDIFLGFTATPTEALLLAALVVLVVPLCEEVLFRGLLWGGLTRLGANVWVTFGVTTVIFALAHFEWPRAILLLVVAVPIGLARIYGSGLLAPIVAHQFNNLLPGIGLYLMLTGAFPVI